MLDIVAFVVTIMQWVLLFFMLGALMLIPLAGMYLVAGEFRDLVCDFQDWAARRRMALYNRKQSQNDQETLNIATEYHNEQGQ